MSIIDKSIYDEMEKVLLESDALMERPLREGRADLGAKPSCHACTEPACCTQALYVTFAEVLPLVRFIRGIDRFDTPELRARLRELGYRMESGNTADWLEEREACAFLLDGKCSVYEYRPVRCRTYWVFSSANLCKPPSGNTVKFANYTSATTMAIDAARQAHRHMGLKETRKRILLGSLPRVVLVALEATDPDVDTQKFVRATAWPADTSISEWVDGKPPESALARLEAWRDAGPKPRDHSTRRRPGWLR